MADFLEFEGFDVDTARSAEEAIRKMSARADGPLRVAVSGRNRLSTAACNQQAVSHPTQASTLIASR